MSLFSEKSIFSKWKPQESISETHKTAQNYFVGLSTGFFLYKQI